MYFCDIEMAAQSVTKPSLFKQFKKDILNNGKSISLMDVVETRKIDLKFNLELKQ